MYDTNVAGWELLAPNLDYALADPNNRNGARLCFWRAKI